MAKIKDTDVKYTTNNYSRLFDNPELGHLLSQVHATTIRNGNELESFLYNWSKNKIVDFDNFIKNYEDNNSYKENLTYCCSKKIFINSDTYKELKISKQPDLVLFKIINKKIKCTFIELKDGAYFDNKKSESERKSIKLIAFKFNKIFKWDTNYFVCSFNETNKEEIKKGFKNIFGIDNIKTGQELCQMLDVNYQKLNHQRIEDSKDNIKYFIEQLLIIPAISQELQKTKSFTKTLAKKNQK